jgi:hypothetical protein
MRSPDHRQLDRRAARTVPQRILHEIGNICVSRSDRRGFGIRARQDFCRQRLFVIFGDVGIDFGDGFDDALTSDR